MGALPSISTDFQRAPHQRLSGMRASRTHVFPTGLEKGASSGHSTVYESRVGEKTV